MTVSTRGPSGVGGRRDGLQDTILEALGRVDRDNRLLPGTGGPAGNALLTAWTGLVILLLSIAELLTLFDVRGLISWHVAIGALLVPPALAKTASTTWRMVRYYLHNEHYRHAGPPPLPLRLLGPLVVLSTLGLLGSGVLLVLFGQDRSHRQLFSVLGFQLDWIGVHQGLFGFWAVSAGLHLLGRLIPGLRITSGPRARSVGPVPARLARGTWFAAMLLAATALAVVLVRSDDSWTAFHLFGPGGPFPSPGR